ncbi:MAG: hypothetical protein MZV64_63885 [Ignavibacteriales bacterium]|nr:hypothetical protein [Ignavibacteriales bacterium]
MLEELRSSLRAGPGGSGPSGCGRTPGPVQRLHQLLADERLELAPARQPLPHRPAGRRTGYRPEQGRHRRGARPAGARPRRGLSRGLAPFRSGGAPGSRCRNIERCARTGRRPGLARSGKPARPEAPG